MNILLGIKFYDLFYEKKIVKKIFESLNGKEENYVKLGTKKKKSILTFKFISLNLWHQLF